ncbi:RDD family protein [Streptomyces griseoaurantiacus]|uniref:RDD family protein n=1 Tax=Streptomyces griseoaurantiacus TaxID=68213 RepID=UPI00362813D0
MSTEPPPPPDDDPLRKPPYGNPPPPGGGPQDTPGPGRSGNPYDTPGQGGGEGYPKYPGSGGEGGTGGPGGPGGGSGGGPYGNPYGTPGQGPGPGPGPGGPGYPGGSGGPYGSGDPFGSYGGGPYGPTPDPLAGMPPLADSGRRVLARLIDLVLVGLVVWLLSWAFHTTEFDYAMDGGEVAYGRSLGQSAIAAVLYIAYDTVLTSRTGQTLGKRWLHLRVADLGNGSTPSVSANLIRAAVLWLPFAFCCACVWTAISGGYSFFDRPYKQGLHDKPAKTVVVSTR